MNVLVTGGAGYIGSIAVEKLIKAGHQVTVLDDLSTGFAESIHKEAKFLNVSLNSFESLDKSLKNFNFESVIHFAAFTNVAESILNPLKYYKNNFEGTVNLLKVLNHSSSIKNFIFSSTAAVYKDPSTNLVSENSETDPVSAYGRSKIMSEQLIRDFSATKNLSFSILRYFNVAGASINGKLGQMGAGSGSLIKQAAKAATGKIDELSIYGTDYPTVDGTGVRDYIHVEDLVNLHVLSLNYLTSGGESGVFNCGYGSGYSVKQVLESMKKVSGVNFRTSLKSRRPGDLAQVVCSNKKVVEKFNWNPEFNDIDFICKSALDWERSLVNSCLA